MSVHNWLLSFQIGETRKIPSNCVGNELKYYARARFGYHMRIAGDKITRFCPACGVQNEF